MGLKRQFSALLLTIVMLLPALAAHGQNSGITIYAATTDNTLISFNSTSPGTLIASTPISGLPDGTTILGIDFRPANGQLFALGSDSRLYRIDTASGAATAAGNAAFNPALNGMEFGFDFNPTVDRIRLVSDAAQDLRLNPNNGAVGAVDGAIGYNTADRNAGTPANLVASAYTNNFGTSTSTVLFGIDSNLDVLVIQNPPNNGTLNTVGSLGIDASGPVGFDIMSDRLGVDSAFASINGSLYIINLGSGAAMLVGAINSPAPIAGIAATASTAPAVAVPLCGDLNGSTSPIVRAGFATGGVFCRVLAENGSFTSSLAGAQIGVQSVLNRGVVQAVDVFVPDAMTNVPFSAPAKVCLQGAGAFVYLNGAQTPRTLQDLVTSVEDGYTCAFIPNPGTVVLVRN